MDVKDSLGRTNKHCIALATFPMSGVVSMGPFATKEDRYVDRRMRMSSQPRWFATRT